MDTVSSYAEIQLSEYKFSTIKAEWKHTLLQKSFIILHILHIAVDFNKPTYC